MNRRDVYYWKCDVPGALSPVPFEAADHDWSACVEEIGRDVFGPKLRRVEPGPGHNRHLTYLLHCDDAAYFFRGDVSGEGDDYLLAETHLIRVLREHSVPIPAVLAADVSLRRWPIAFQISERVPYQALSHYDQRGELDRVAVAEQLGVCMARIHTVEAPGFGFLDVQQLINTGRMQGLDSAYTDYFVRRLTDHLGELAESELLEVSEVDAIGKLLERHLPLTRLSQGCVVHRDLAFWNVLGEPHAVRAVIDWEDAVLGDPADDLGVFNCFYDEMTMAALLRGYARDKVLPDNFMTRVWLHTLRNMVWKAALRHRMRYFDTASGSFIRSRENTTSLRDFTIERIRQTLRYLQEERT